MVSLEVCANSAQSAIEAQKGGASRVELCTNLSIGGITPSAAEIKKARESLNIDLNVLIRNRGGNFIYSDLEFEIMKNEILYCASLKCNGVVFGILNSDGFIDKKRNEELIRIAKEHNLSTTFHRAFDYSPNLFESLEEIVDLGFDRILSSGGRKTAIEGTEILRELVEKARNRIIIMPGSGINEENISELISETKAKEFHGSFSKKINIHKCKYSQSIPDEIDEYEIYETDANVVRRIIEITSSKKNIND